MMDDEIEKRSSNVPASVYNACRKSLHKKRCSNLRAERGRERVLLYRVRTSRCLAVHSGWASLRLAIRVRPGVRGRWAATRIGCVAVALVVDHGQLCLDATAVREVPKRGQDGQNHLSQALAGSLVGIVNLSQTQQTFNAGNTRCHTEV